MNSMIATRAWKFFSRPAKKIFEVRFLCKARCSVARGHQFHTSTSVERYEESYRRSISYPEDFWHEAAQDIDWYTPYKQVLSDADSPFAKWFVGGEMNTCYNAFDRHVDSGHGEQLALIYDSPVTNAMKKCTYKELLDEVSLFAGGLKSLGVAKGDRVVIYMPMIPQAVVAMLACSRIGAIHSVVFGGFASEELGRRIQHAESKANIIHGRDIEWNDFMAKASSHECVPVEATDPLYILYTSGTTGIVRPSGGYAVALKWSMKHLYGINPGEVWWAASDLGWVVGHSYIVYAPLLSRATTVLFEGKPVGTPGSGAFFRVIEEHKVCSMFTAPTALRIIRTEDSDGKILKKYDLSHVRYLFLAGEHCDRDTLNWATKAIKCPVLDHWWQTETGWPITAHAVGLGDVATEHLHTTGKPVPGYNVRIINPDLTCCKNGVMGQVTVRCPLPPGVASTLWKNDKRFFESYFEKYPGHYDTMDEGIMDFIGCVTIMTRADDVINVAGHRLSSKAIEEALLKDEDVGIG